MFHDSGIVAVVPCYNEANRIAGVIRTLPDFVDHAVIVDDGSRDQLAEAVRAVWSSRLVMIRHDVNGGLARAMESGFRKALELGADIVVKLDGDGQMDPLELPRLLAPLVAGHADMTKGNRFLSRRHLSGMPTIRVIGNLGLSFLTKVASGYWNIFDPTNGYIAVRRQVLEEIDLARLGPRHFFETALLCHAYLVGAVVRDVSMPARYGSESSSLSPWWTLVRFPYLLMCAAARRIALQHFIRDFTPVALFLLSGVVMAGAGFAYGLMTWMHNAQLHQPTPPGTIAVIGLPVLAGFQLLLQALVMDVGSVPTRSPWPRHER
jgi:glycosyltransferase involved in cell wall biosynthesis